VRSRYFSIVHMLPIGAAADLKGSLAGK